MLRPSAAASGAGVEPSYGGFGIATRSRALLTGEPARASYPLTGFPRMLVRVAGDVAHDRLASATFIVWGRVIGCSEQ